jgi:hypothetical protein
MGGTVACYLEALNEALLGESGRRFLVENASED